VESPRSQCESVCVPFPPKPSGSFLKKKGNLVACNDVDGLMTVLNINHKPEEWRLFIDSSKSSLKVVLLHNGNVLPSIPVSYAVNMKES
jgi:hypothetical protein